MGVDLNLIAENLAELLTSVVNTTTKFYDLFINPEPKDVTVYLFNNDNKLVEQTIPNLAKARQSLTGDTDPENNVVGNLGQLYINRSTSDVFVKASGGNSTKLGWTQVPVSNSIETVLNGYVPPENLYTLTNSGNIELESGKSYKVSLAGNAKFILPATVSDTGVVNKIHVQLKNNSTSNQILFENLISYNPIIVEGGIVTIDGVSTKNAIYMTPDEAFSYIGNFILDFEYLTADTSSGYQGWHMKVGTTQSYI